MSPRRLTSWVAKPRLGGVFADESKQSEEDLQLKAELEMLVERLKVGQEVEDAEIGVMC